jgi:hypothetical protein
MHRLLLLFSLLFLLACTHSPCKVPPVNRLRACQDIRRQLIFLNNSDPTLYPYQYMAATWGSPTRQALLLRKYRELQCGALLGECPPPAVPCQGR